jgi:demethylmenaquinone methyltransferase/2-methoxy-6-polyprenyl-1,4-benzoquinol methylase
MASDDRDLIDDQIRYYRARATEYDATSTIDDDPFAPDSGRIRAALRALAPFGHALELAAGTGQWTGLLAELADDLVATDASPEMLALNAAKIGKPYVEYRVSDAFALERTHGFDTVFCGFFLSHVPPSRFEPFWAVLDGLLVPDGRVLFVDEAAHGLWDEDWLDREAGVVQRSLRDGTTHRAVKVLWRANELEQRLRGLGWHASVHAEGPFFWGTAHTG